MIDTSSLPVDPAETCPGTTIETGLQEEPTAMTFLESGPGSVTLVVAGFQNVYLLTIPGASNPAMRARSLARSSKKNGAGRSLLHAGLPDNSFVSL